MDQISIVHISSLSTIIILSIVLLVNSIKTKNKLVMYLSIGTLVVSVGCLTYCLIHHFTSIKDDGDMKDIIKSTYQYIGDSFVNAERKDDKKDAEIKGDKEDVGRKGDKEGGNVSLIDDFVVDPKSVDDGLALVKHHKITLDELRQHAKTIKTDLSTIMELKSTVKSSKQSEFEKYIDDFSKEIYWITPILDKLIIKSITSMLQKQTP